MFTWPSRINGRSERQGPKRKRRAAESNFLPFKMLVGLEEEKKEEGKRKKSFYRIHSPLPLSSRPITKKEKNTHTDRGQATPAPRPTKGEKEKGKRKRRKHQRVFPL